ncbi:MAG: hypothetical protein PVJ43_07770 [Gemmatimonadales bacterium]
METQQVASTQPSRAIAIIMAADSGQRQLWAVRGAVAIARGLARDHQVVLADLQRRAPSALAAVLDAGKGPGIVDALFRGASFAEAARRPQFEPFIFIPLGDKPPPLATLYGHPGWAKIARSLRGNDAVLLACAAADDWLEAGPITGFEACIVLNANGVEVRLPPRAKRIAEAVAPPRIRQVARRDTGLPQSAMRRSDAAIQAVASGCARGAEGQEAGTEVEQGAEEFTAGLSNVLDRRVARLPSGPRFVLFPASHGERVRRRRRHKRSRRKRAARVAVTAALALAAALSVWMAVWLAVIAASCRAHADSGSIASEPAGWEVDFAGADRIEGERPVRSDVWSCMITEVESRLLQGESQW